MEKVRQIGKYITIAACITAVVVGVIRWKYFAPIELSIACWIGLMIWIFGAVGVRIQRYRESQRSSK